MSEKIRAVLDAVTDRVLAFRPTDKGRAAVKTKRRLARQLKEASDDRESSK